MAVGCGIGGGLQAEMGVPAGRDWHIDGGELLERRRKSSHPCYQIRVVNNLFIKTALTWLKGMRIV